MSTSSTDTLTPCTRCQGSGTEPDALAAAQERTLTILSSVAAAVGKGNVALARMLADDDLKTCLDELDLAAEAEIAERLRNG